jgi:hypothetical protein
MKLAVYERDAGCVGVVVGFPGECLGGLEPDHVRASHGTGMKSRTELDNLAALCAGHHRWKTEHGKQARPLLLAYLERIGDPHAHHVDPCGADCPAGRPR